MKVNLGRCLQDPREQEAWSSTYGHARFTARCVGPRTEPSSCVRSEVLLRGPTTERQLALQCGPDLFVGPGSNDALWHAATATAQAVTSWACSETAVGAWSGIGPNELAAAIADLDPCPPEGRPLEQALAELGPTVLAHGVRQADPFCAAHLHSPTLVSAAAAELAIGATNQSLDSFDQAPAATLVEEHLVRWLARLLGLPARASGVLTAGGTASNLLGLLLARDHTARQADADWSLARQGLPPQAAGWRIICSEASHFSIQRAASVLGLGHRAVLTVATDRHDRLDVASLDRAISRLSPDERVMAIVGTAGTTDAGALDPLREMAARARSLGAWFHVDAAVGGALVLSEPLQGMLSGIDQADSVVVDFHKLWWQPIGASALLVRDASVFDRAVRHTSDYLDRDEDGDSAEDLPPNLVSRSLDTSRRFDALKVLIGLRTAGREQLAAMLEHLVATTTAASRVIEHHPALELLRPVSTVMLLFRWRPGLTNREGEPPPGDAEPDEDALDVINTQTQQTLFASGEAVIGRTRVNRAGTARPVVALKLTLVNPRTNIADLTRLVDLVARRATAIAEAGPPPRPSPPAPTRPGAVA